MLNAFYQINSKADLQIKRFNTFLDFLLAKIHEKVIYCPWKIYDTQLWRSKFLYYLLIVFITDLKFASPYSIFFMIFKQEDIAQTNIYIKQKFSRMISDSVNFFKVPSVILHME